MPGGGGGPGERQARRIEKSAYNRSDISKAAGKSIDRKLNKLRGGGRRRGMLG